MAEVVERTCYVCGRPAESPKLPLCMHHDGERLQAGMTATAVLLDASLPEEQRTFRFRGKKMSKPKKKKTELRVVKKVKKNDGPPRVEDLSKLQRGVYNKLLELLDEAKLLTAKEIWELGESVQVHGTSHEDGSFADWAVERLLMELFEFRS